MSDSFKYDIGRMREVRRTLSELDRPTVAKLLRWGFLSVRFRTCEQVLGRYIELYDSGCRRGDIVGLIAAELKCSNRHIYTLLYTILSAL